MKQEHASTTMKIITSALLLVLLTTNVHASSLVQAQESIDNFYRYAQEQNVDAYAALFDQEYLLGLYGTDYKKGLAEVLSYITITDYKITPQYYTESEDSLTYFFNLESNVIIENEKTQLDNDLVALFTKKNNEVKLRYVMLQETFIEQMNREVIYKGAIMSMTEEYSDLITEAENKDVSLVDYESLIKNNIQKDNKKQLLIIIILLIIIGAGTYAFIKHKEKIVTKKNKQRVQKHLEKAKHRANTAKKNIVKTYKKTIPKVKNAASKTIENVKANKHYQNIIKKNKKIANEKVTKK